MAHVADQGNMACICVRQLLEYVLDLQAINQG